MQKLHFSIVIDAPVDKVWHTMLDDATYRQWTVAFTEGSYFEGSWEEGSAIRFLGPNPNGGAEGGMYAEIAKNVPGEFISIHHLGEIENGVEKPFDGLEIHENYSFADLGGKTQLDVDVDSNDEWAEMFSEMWPQALDKLKEIAEA